MILQLIEAPGINARHQVAGLGMHHKASLAVQDCGEIVVEAEDGADQPLQTQI